MRILIVDNNFQGAYGSFQIFIDEIERALRKNLHTVYRAHNVIEAVSVYENEKPDFSIGIGRYLMFIENCALCDFYGVEHYQWIVDNPIKVSPPEKCFKFTPVFIDEEFPLLWPWKPEKYLCLPLGFERPAIKSSTPRKQGIVFSGQVKNLESLRAEINSSSQKISLQDFLNRAEDNLDKSFILQYRQFLDENRVDDEKEFFRLANSFLRCMKRLIVLQSIRNYPLILAGDIQDEKLIRKANVTCLGRISYTEVMKLFAEYEFVLNISPNFSCCIHDRILRALAAGSRVITDRNSTVSAAFGENLSYFDYDSLRKSEMLSVKKSEPSGIDEILVQFEWENILAEVIGDYTKRNGK